MRIFTIFLLVIGLFSCLERKKVEDDFVSEEKIKNKTENGGFNLLDDFSLNKDKFHRDTLEILNHSTEGGELITYYHKKINYKVMDYWLYGEMGKLNYTYYIDKDFKFKLVKKVNYKYNQPFYEEGYTMDSTVFYFVNSPTYPQLFDIDRVEIKGRELVDSIKNELEVLYFDMAKEIEIVK